MPSFDVVSEINIQEADNAVNQARKEIEGRFDFKGSQCEIQWDKSKKEMTLLGDDEYRMEAMKGILQTKLHRRGVDIKAVKFGDLEPAGGKMQRQKVQLLAGIDREIAKDITKLIKDSKLKVQAQVVDDKVRVTSKSIDELQSTMQLLRGADIKMPLQFTNMRS